MTRPNASYPESDCRSTAGRCPRPRMVLVHRGGQKGQGENPIPRLGFPLEAIENISTRVLCKGKTDAEQLGYVEMVQVGS
jgi:hypothetical protein